MDTNSVWSTLADIKIGTLIAWAIVIIAILTVIIKGITKLYEVFAKYKKLKEDNERQSELLRAHDETLAQINVSLRHINECLEEQKGVNLKQIRHTIVDTCYEALKAGEIQIGKLKSLEEMFQEYTDIFHGNGYVKRLVTQVEELPKVGSLDD